MYQGVLFNTGCSEKDDAWRRNAAARYAMSAAYLDVMEYRPPCSSSLEYCHIAFALRPYPQSASPSFRPGSSTFVLPKIEPLLYPESYCSLVPTRIHSPFD